VDVNALDAEKLLTFEDSLQNDNELFRRNLEQNDCNSQHSQVSKDIGLKIDRMKEQLSSLKKGSFKLQNDHC